MNRNASIILTLCSHLCVGENINPLEPKEWGELNALLQELKIQPHALFDYSLADIKALGLSQEYAERIQRLVDRNASLLFELGEYENMGIYALTEADSAFPSKLKKPHMNCPPILYCAGELRLLQAPCVGYVGSRTVCAEDVAFTKATVAKTVQNGYGVVSGGAKGIDDASERAALEQNAPVVEFLCDSMLKRLRKSEKAKGMQAGKLLLVSVATPDAGFHVGIAMMRNRYIYAQSAGTVIVRSDYKKGGTWAGATDTLRHKWCNVLCWDNKSYPGNQALLKMGAVAIKEDWDGDIDATIPFEAEQLSFFHHA